MPEKTDALDRLKYLPPWRDRLPDGSLSEPYGPSSAAALARQSQRARDWSYRSEHGRAVSKESLREGVRIRAWLAEHASELPDRERQVAQLVYLDGHAARWVARTLEISRASVRSYLQRIKARLTDSPESDSQ